LPAASHTVLYPHEFGVQACFDDLGLKTTGRWDGVYHGRFYEVMHTPGIMIDLVCDDFLLFGVRLDC
jgi:hypothetical protein